MPKPSVPADSGLTIPDPLSVTSSTRLGPIPAKADADDRWLGMANRVADRFLSDSEEVLLDRRRQEFFGYTVPMKVAMQPALDIGPLD
jgi:hypothetical protein